MTEPHQQIKGFTLVEVTIVLVVIGLLTAGVITGLNLVKSAELQEVASNFSEYRRSAKLFRDKYKYLPGDMPTATSFWGTGTCDDTAADTFAEATCNGNGDGFITGSDGTAMNLGSDHREALYAWQHLSNAKLVQKTYSGRAGTGVTWWKPGTNMPEGMEVSAGYGIHYASTGQEVISIDYPGIATTVEGNTFNAQYHHVITYGGTLGMTSGLSPTRMVLSPEDAHIIDSKIDDGKPGRGNVLTNASTIDSGVSYFCVDGNAHTTAAYLISAERNLCALFFITGM